VQLCLLLITVIWWVRLRHYSTALPSVLEWLLQVNLYAAVVAMFMLVVSWKTIIGQTILVYIVPFMLLTNVTLYFVRKKR
jgi:hypothetical protein